LLLMSMFPMSDVAGAALWTAALLLASRTAWAAHAAAGVVSGIAITVRPNLAPLAVVPALIAASSATGAGVRPAVRAVLVFASACLPFVLFIAWLNNDLYGSPLLSGYGDATSLFAAAHIGANAVRFPRWLWDTQGPLLFAFPLAAWIRGPKPSGRALRRMLLVFVAGVFACYLGYTPFNAWWYLRFVLPALPVMFVLAADVAWCGTRRFGTRAQIAATVIVACVAVDYGLTPARQRGAFAIGDGEQKYADVGRYVAANLPVNAVVLAVQHSGSIRYYAQRRTLQWEWLDGAWLDRAIEHLRGAGFEPYLVLEEFELAAFRERFASQRGVAFVDRPPQAIHSRGVRIFGTGPVPTGAPRVIPHTTGCE
jgi:hypothetical protein